MTRNSVSLRRLGRVALAAFAFALLAGCGDGTPNAPAPLRPVRAQKVQAMAVTDLPGLVGEIRPHFESDLGFKIAGKVIRRPVDLGNVVKAGDVLAQLDDQDQRNQMHVAEADLAAAKASLVQTASEERRKVILERDGWDTRQQLEAAQEARQTAEANVRAAEARLRLARDQLSYTLLRAPADGAISELGVDAGHVVAAGQMVVRLARLDERDGVFSVAESAVHALSLGEEMTVGLLDTPSVTTKGTIAQISPGADSTTRTYTVKVALPAAPATMRFGMTATGRFAGKDGRAVELPATALFQKDGKPAVWVLDETSKSVSLIEVGLLRVDEGHVLIDSGLADGTLVVTAGVQSLRPGQKVRLMEADGSK